MTEAWLRSWLEAADEALRRAPAGRSAREELAADRNRLGAEVVSWDGELIDRAGALAPTDWIERNA